MPGFVFGVFQVLIVIIPEKERFLRVEQAFEDGFFALIKRIKTNKYELFKVLLFLLKQEDVFSKLAVNQSVVTDTLLFKGFPEPMVNPCHFVP